MGDFGFDYDKNDVLFHYGDGFAVGTDGRQYREIPGDQVVDLQTGEVHYAPQGQNVPLNGLNKPEKQPEKASAAPGRYEICVVLNVLFSLAAIVLAFLMKKENGVWTVSPRWLFLTLIAALGFFFAARFIKGK